MDTVIQPDVLYDFTVQVFVRVGVPLEDAHLAAAVRLESALRQPAGLDAFSVMRLRNTLRRLQAGGINPRPCLTVVREQPHIAVLDGDNGLGAVIGSRAMECCLAKAQGQGMALVGVRNSTTLGMMAFYAMRALEHHAIGFAATNTELKIGLPPWGGVTPALGNNPFAMAIPTGQEPALVLDMSVIATAPQHRQDTQTTSAREPLGSDFVSRAVIGDHKGYGLALVLEVLTGVLTGAGFGLAHAPEQLATSAARYDLGHLFGVLNPATFMPLELFYARIQQLAHDVTHVQRAPGTERIFLPGELEHERRQERLQYGIPVYGEAPAALQELCAGLSLTSPLAS